jgi:hypothetical protein
MRLANAYSVEDIILRLNQIRKNGELVELDQLPSAKTVNQELLNIANAANTPNMATPNRNQPSIPPITAEVPATSPNIIKEERAKTSIAEPPPWKEEENPKYDNSLSNTDEDRQTTSESVVDNSSINTDDTEQTITESVVDNSSNVQNVKKAPLLTEEMAILNSIPSEDDIPTISEDEMNSFEDSILPKASYTENIVDSSVDEVNESSVSMEFNNISFEEITNLPVGDEVRLDDIQKMELLKENALNNDFVNEVLDKFDGEIVDIHSVTSGDSAHE